MKIKQYATALALTGAMALTPYQAQAGRIGNFFEGLVGTASDAIVSPYKVIKSTVKELDPVKGARRAVVDVAESAGRTVLLKPYGKDTPMESGSANNELEEHPLLEAVVDIGVAAGAGALIAGANADKANTAGHAAAWAAGGEAVIKIANSGRLETRVGRSRGKGSSVTKGYEIAHK
jgi:hypothetical protein